MFRGVSTLALDSKGRIAIPTRYRERLQENCASQLVVTVDRDHCLLLYPLPEWQLVEDKLNRLPSFNRAARSLQRLYIGHAAELEMDGQGRVLLPNELRRFANLQKQVVLAGQGKKFELWDEDTWNEKRDAWLSEDDDGELPPDLESIAF